MEASPFQLRMIAALSVCPTCRCDARETNGPEDGIPDGSVHETVFECGARVEVTKDGYRLGAACPWPLDQALGDLLLEVEEQDEGEAL